MAGVTGPRAWSTFRMISVKSASGVAQFVSHGKQCLAVTKFHGEPRTPAGKPEPQFSERAARYATPRTAYARTWHGETVGTRPYLPGRAQGPSIAASKSPPQGRTETTLGFDSRRKCTVNETIRRAINTQQSLCGGEATTANPR
jgi:hypothetical protein